VTAGPVVAGRRRELGAGSALLGALCGVALALLALRSGPVSCAPAIPTGPVRHLFDLKGLPGDELALPSDVAVAADGRVYVVDGGNHRLVVFGPEGQGLFVFGHQGEAEGEFSGPVGLGLGADGRVFVADTGNRRIQVFNPDGGFEYAFPVTSGGTPVRPVDVAMDPTGERLYVTGKDSHSLLVYSPTGELLETWGHEGLNAGEFRYPATVAVAPAGTEAGPAIGAIYVVDVLNTRVQVFAPSGELLVQVGSWGVRPGQLFRPKGVAIDGNGNLYVSDSYLEVVQVFDDNSRFLHVLGRPDGEVQRFTTPTGLAVDGQGRLYVAEMWGNKVSVYGLGTP